MSVEERDVPAKLASSISELHAKIGAESQNSALIRRFSVGMADAVPPRMLPNEILEYLRRCEVEHRTPPQPQPMLELPLPVAPMPETPPPPEPSDRGVFVIDLF